MPKKTADKAVMDALAKRIKAIHAGTARPSKPSQGIDFSLRQAIKASGLTHYRLGQEAGVAPSQIDRFMLPADDPRHRDLRLETAAKIASVLGLELRPR